MIEKTKLPRPLSPDFADKAWSARESWRTLGIMSEFVEATERLSEIRPAVSVFGSARTEPGHPHYALAEQIARRLSDAGFSVISGGGPGIMEAANKGAYFGKSPSVGLNVKLPREQRVNPYQVSSRRMPSAKYCSTYRIRNSRFGKNDCRLRSWLNPESGSIFFTEKPII